jgi:hypothetical protein
MDKLQKGSNLEYICPMSEPFRTEELVLLFVIVRKVILKMLIVAAC